MGKIHWFKKLIRHSIIYVLVILFGFFISYLLCEYTMSFAKTSALLIFIVIGWNYDKIHRYIFRD